MSAICCVSDLAGIGTFEAFDQSQYEGRPLLEGQLRPHSAGGLQRRRNLEAGVAPTKAARTEGAAETNKGASSPATKPKKRCSSSGTVCCPAAQHVGVEQQVMGRPDVVEAVRDESIVVVHPQH